MIVLKIALNLLGTFANYLDLTPLGESDLRSLEFSQQPDLVTTFSIDEYILTDFDSIVATTPTKYIGCYTFPVEVSTPAILNVTGTTITSPFEFNSSVWDNPELNGPNAWVNSESRWNYYDYSESQCFPD
jgi:hypothetical protein